MTHIAFFELFSGSGVAASVAKKKGWTVYTLDIDPKCNPTFTMDICDWTENNSQELINKHVNCKWIIHASPECKEYSIAKPLYKRNPKKGDILVKAALKIIKHFWKHLIIASIENPVGNTGSLVTRNVMKKMESGKWLYRKRIDYCQYGDNPYVTKKPTYIWLTRNYHRWTPRICNNKCKYGSISNCGKWKHTLNFNDIPYKFRARIPKKVFEELYKYIKVQ